MLKVCTKCGKRQNVPPKRRKCHQMGRGGTGFKSGYWCYGVLQRIERPKKPKTLTRQAKTIESKLTLSQEKLKDTDYRIKRLTTARKRWARRVKIYSGMLAKQRARIEDNVAHGIRLIGDIDEA